MTWEILVFAQATSVTGGGFGCVGECTYTNAPHHLQTAHSTAVHSTSHSSLQLHQRSSYPRPHSNRTGEGTVTFRFANLLRRLDIELLLCVCWLRKVVRPATAPLTPSARLNGICNRQ